MRVLEKRRNPYPAVDIIIEDKDRIVLVKRAKEPWKGKLAFPGGFIEWGESAEFAAKREAKEETNLDVELTDILGVYNIDNDPRGYIVTIVFIARPLRGVIMGGDDAANANWYSINQALHEDIVVKHYKVLLDYIKWKKKKGTYWSTRR